MQGIITEPLRRKVLNRNFSELMELYELNYLNLRRLAPDLDGLGDHSISALNSGLDLHYRLIEKCKYTITFSLTYQFGRHNGAYQAPDLHIRFYQDARVAEVLSGVLHRHCLHAGAGNLFHHHLNLPTNNLMNRWRLNRFLHKWLNFCLKQGHLLRPAWCMSKIENVFCV